MLLHARKLYFSRYSSSTLTQFYARAGFSQQVEIPINEVEIELFKAEADAEVGMRR